MPFPIAYKLYEIVIDHFIPIFSTKYILKKKFTKFAIAKVLPARFTSKLVILNAFVILFATGWIKIVF